jgi:hypothetical protein
MIEVRGIGAPGIEEIAELLLAEVIRRHFRRPDAQEKVFIGQVSESHLTAAPNIERNGSVSFVADCALLATVVEILAQYVRVEQQLNRVPFIGPKTTVREIKGQFD